MKSHGMHAIELRIGNPWQMSRRGGVLPSHLYLVTPHELQNLREALARGVIPADLELKLARLAAGGLSHRFIEQTCRTIIDLLAGAQGGLFRDISDQQRELLLRVLAYVRKEDDAIADYRADGYSDDQQELRAALIESMPAVQSFKAWRLRHQVPAMW